MRGAVELGLWGPLGVLAGWPRDVASNGGNAIRSRGLEGCENEIREPYPGLYSPLARL